MTPKSSPSGAVRRTLILTALALFGPVACDDAPPEPTATLYACFHSPECYDALADAVERDDVSIAYIPEDGAETHLALRLMQIRGEDWRAERDVLRRLVAWHEKTGNVGIGPAFSFVTPEETGVVEEPSLADLQATLTAQRQAFEEAGGDYGPLLQAND